MLRVVLVGLVLACPLAACKSSDDTVKVQPGVAAGKVIEVVGEVTVRHGTEARPLAAGDTVEGDDTVITGADGNVVIELAHNLVRWKLGPNKQQKVRESIAWNAPKHTGSATQVEQDTAAAGRPAERGAADTVATAGAAEVERAEERAPAPEPAAAPPPPPPAATAPRRERAAPSTAPAPPARIAKDPLPLEEGTMGSRSRGPERKVDAPPSGPPGGPPGDGAFGAPAPERVDSKAPPESAAVAVPSTSPAQALLEQKRGALAACLKGHGARVELTVTRSRANATPAVTLSSSRPVSTAAEACVKKIVASLAFPAASRATIRLEP